MANGPDRGSGNLATYATMGAVVLVGVVFTAVVVGVALLLDDDSDEAAHARTVDVELGDFFIDPAEVPVAPNTELTLRVVNTGDIQHDIKLEGDKGTERLAAGETAEVNVGVVSPGQILWCTVPGHREQGMESSIVPGPSPQDRDPE